MIYSKKNKSQEANTYQRWESKKATNSSSLLLKDYRPQTAIQKKQVTAMASTSASQHLIQKKNNQTGLPDNLKTGIENLSGYAMDDVKVHYNSNKPKQLQAYAYAQGINIHIASGQEKHLPHEAWHVVQQKQGRVRPTMQTSKGVSINEDTSLETEADVMGTKALQKKSIGNSQKGSDEFSNKTLIPNSTITQRFKVPDGLEHLSEEVKGVIGSIKVEHLPGGSSDKELYGSKQWGNDTFWAANRKLDEWNLVKQLFSGGTDLKDAIEIGFGINDTTEADAIVYNKDHNAVIAGENKIVSGGFSQVVENINSALSQLTTGKRANKYKDTNLIARVSIGGGSGALNHMRSMSSGVQKGMQTRWSKRLLNAYKEGEKNWSGKCTLRLIIRTPTESLFDKTL